MADRQHVAIATGTSGAEAASEASGPSADRAIAHSAALACTAFLSLVSSRASAPYAQPDVVPQLVHL